MQQPITAPNEVSPLANAIPFNDYSVRIALDERSDPWFCAQDVFEAMGITWIGRSASLKSVPDKWVCLCQCHSQPGSSRTFLHKGAMYMVVFRSKKASAVAFVEWVCGDVLPALRKQGFYGTVPPDRYLTYWKQIAAMTESLVAARDAYQQRALIQGLRCLYTAVGQEMPDLDLLGKDPKQVPLNLH